MLSAIVIGFTNQAVTVQNAHKQHILSFLPTCLDRDVAMMGCWIALFSLRVGF